MSKPWFGRMSESSIDSRDDTQLLPQHEMAPLHARVPEPELSSSTRAIAVDDSFLRQALPDYRKSDPSKILRMPRMSSALRSHSKEDYSTHFEDVPPPITSFVLRNTSTNRSLYSSRTSMSQNSWHTAGTPASASASASILDGRPPALPASLSNVIRNSSALQDELQRLLDLQVDGLVQGWHTQARDEVRGGKSRAPVESSQYLGRSSSSGLDMKSMTILGSRRNRRIIPVRQPEAGKVTLQATRKAILQCILMLSTLKGHEIELWKSAYHELGSSRQRVVAWQENIENLASKIHSINNSAASKELKDLQEEIDATENEIKEQEIKLKGLRAKQSRLSVRIKESQNVKEATTSSFQEGKRQMQKDIARYLERPITADTAALIHESTRREPEVVDDDEGQIFLMLPAKRRTLGMGLVFLDRSIKQLKEQLDRHDTELCALENGAKMWADVLDMITDFEAHLREEMRHSSTSKDEHMLKDQVGKMEGVMKNLATQLQLCRDRGWNLLVCAMGAELEAFDEGYKILRRVLASTTDENVKGRSSTGRDAHDDRHDLTPRSQAAHDGSRAFLRQQDALDDKSGEVKENTSESEDEGPHPDLLSEDRIEDEVDTMLGL